MAEDKQILASQPVVEETVHLSTRTVPTATLRVSTTTEHARQHVETPLEIQDVLVERVPVGRWVDGALAPRQEGDTTIFSVVEEVAVVERRFRLIEEVRVTRRTRSETFAADIDLRHNRVSVERTEMKPNPKGRQ
ncbi:DUF2382 domain-containing protein [Magnetospirillum sp. UT-4]|uniref:DUF2382 domain-containing protein n=1 Tax=Magnetospirillum sp. UT-4 TaxID=2681467 RepID=UPI00137DF027|nr:DUF2382 domain-containing protein [Magnetospirillum sp. UT-4]CAA7625863.1 conserved hypothetical protein [Magnetospirillum sp. UT-4]